MAHRVHLDYATNASLRPEAKDSMIKAADVANFDARRLYDDAIGTRYQIETCRQLIAAFFGCDPFEVIFTSSHSESLATFAYGVVHSKDQLQKSNNVVGTPYDSEIIVETWLRENIEHRLISGNTNATLELNELSELVDENTLALSVPFAHPDTGTLQDVSQIAEAVRNINPNCIVHLDARLAPGNARLNFAELGVGAMSVDPVTFGGPSGVGGFILSRKHHIAPLLAGSTQERARRAGQENYMGIAGFASAAQATANELDSLWAQNEKFKSVVIDSLKSAGASFLNEDTSNDLNCLVAAYFPGVAASAVVGEFNRLGINIHAGSSCGSEEFEPSRQLRPVTNSDELSESVFRISWGWATTSQDIEAFQSALKELPFTSQNN